MNGTGTRTGDQWATTVTIAGALDGTACAADDSRLDDAAVGVGADGVADGAQADVIQSLTDRARTVAGPSPSAHSDRSSGTKSTGRETDGPNVGGGGNGSGELDEGDIVGEGGRRVARMSHDSAGLGCDTAAVAQGDDSQVGGDAADSLCAMGGCEDPVRADQCSTTERGSTGDGQVEGGLPRELTLARCTATDNAAADLPEGGISHRRGRWRGSWQKWEFCWQSQSGGRAQDKKSEVKHCGFGSEDCTEMSSFISICRQMDAI
jgi:hypothetical protein